MHFVCQVGCYMGFHMQWSFGILKAVVTGRNCKICSFTTKRNLFSRFSDLRQLLLPSIIFTRFFWSQQFFQFLKKVLWLGCSKTLSPRPHVYLLRIFRCILLWPLSLHFMHMCFGKKTFEPCQLLSKTCVHLPTTYRLIVTTILLIYSWHGDTHTHTIKCTPVHP